MFFGCGGRFGVCCVCRVCIRRACVFRHSFSLALLEEETIPTARLILCSDLISSWYGYLPPQIDLNQYPPPWLYIDMKHGLPSPVSSVARLHGPTALRVSGRSEHYGRNCLGCRWHLHCPRQRCQKVRGWRVFQGRGSRPRRSCGEARCGCLGCCRFCRAGGLCAPRAVRVTVAVLPGVFSALLSSVAGFYYFCGILYSVTKKYV